MDLGCLDLGYVSVSDKQGSDLAATDSASKKEDSYEPVSASSRSAKSKLSKESNQPTMHGLNKCTLQIKKPPHRKASPLNWFPRTKVDSYLIRKIKMLQEVDGLNLTLDETLGDSNPHYSRVLKEKMATREAAEKAMEARKAALVEASWCRILRAARIQSKEAEEQLFKAEKTATEAFEAAASLGVIMYDTFSCPQTTCKVEITSASGGGSTTHTVSASFETEFEVDKEVAAAVKTALIRLANCSSFREEFKELLRKISQNPDDDEHVDPPETSSECESDSALKLDKTSENGDFSPHNMDFKKPGLRVGPKECRRQSFETKIEDLMYERLRRLKEDELSSLATIVATCGLNAALAELESSRLHGDAGSFADQSSGLALNLPRRMSSAGSKNYLHNGRKQAETDLPSLDKFLVKHMTKLEREVLAAKKTRENEQKENIKAAALDGDIHMHKPTSQNMEAKEQSSELKRELDENKCAGEEESKIDDTSQSEARQKLVRRKEEISEVPSLDKYLVKHVSQLEKEVQEAKHRRKNELRRGGRIMNLKEKSNSYPSEESSLENLHPISTTDEEKENVNLGNYSSKRETNMEDSLEKILVKPVHRLEREKMLALLAESNWQNQRQKKKHVVNNASECQSLDQILVKHVSRLEKEKMRCSSTDKPESVKRSEKTVHSVTNGGGGLDEILVKHKSRLEREKLMASQESEKQNKDFFSRREARERDLQAAWGGLSLGDSIIPHLSKLERDKAAWIKAEEEERKQV